MDASELIWIHLQFRCRDESTGFTVGQRQFTLVKFKYPALQAQALQADGWKRSTTQQYPRARLNTIHNGFEDPLGTWVIDGVNIVDDPRTTLWDVRDQAF
jgi:hypothetical protein